ncbi:MAG: DUF5947 family protein, partial [Acidimicrobiales bacterium]
RAATEGAGATEERCDICSEQIDERHGHLVDLEQRRLLCACRPCSLLFDRAGAGGHRIQAVPDRYRDLSEIAFETAAWEALDIPVGVAFLFHNSQLGRIIAHYPSPAGATETMLPLDAWGQLVEHHPALSDLVADVEAVLTRTGTHRGPQSATGQQRECYLVPIDICYELVGEVRRTWRGLDGGRESHEAIDAVFAKVRARAGMPRHA